jgi:hypothetical protein
LIVIKGNIARKSKLVNLGLNWKNSQPRTFFEKDVKLQGPNLVEDRDEIENNWKFNSQMRINLYKSKTKDHNEKGVEIQGWYWSLAGGKLHKIKSSRSIRDVIKRNQKS